MGNHLKKSTYLLAVLFVSFVLFLIYHLFFDVSKPATPNHSTLALTPFTTNEQKDLIAAQEQEESLIDSGPLVAKMNVTDAEARVLNLSREKAPNSGVSF